MRTLATALLCLFSACALADIQVDDARVPAAPPTASVLTAYMTLHNRGEADRHVIAFRSEQFERIEMHRSEVVDGVARMQAVESIELPAGESVSLEAGGLHLMMFQPVEPLAVGDEVVLELQLDGNELQTLTLPVAKRRTQGHQHGHHHTP